MNLMEQASFAEIAQLVEHDLAKVGVASSSLVFRSKVARMVESVDTRDLKSLGHCGCAGSSPASSTGKMLCKSMIYGAFSFLYAGLDLSLLHSVYAFLRL